MKVVVRSKERNFTIPIPMFMLANGSKFTSYISKMICKNKGDRNKFIESMKYLDMDAISLGLRELSEDKGLILLEAESSNGSYILIKI
ncbi:hypothetical protein ACQPU1_01815 [Clostridium paraputrificum]|uniref:hypothetical protein n=1 Tax=Clostridium TaxID=1485 RepID=UPI003D351287